MIPTCRRQARPRTRHSWPVHRLPLCRPRLQSWHQCRACSNPKLREANQAGRASATAQGNARLQEEAGASLCAQHQRKLEPKGHLCNIRRYALPLRRTNDYDCGLCSTLNIGVGTLVSNLWTTLNTKLDGTPRLSTYGWLSCRECPAGV